MPLKGKIITGTGQVLWDNHERAMTYAEARHLLYGAKQQVRQVVYMGRRVWHVRAALPKVAEPCS